MRQHALVAVSFARLAVQRQLEYPLFLANWLVLIPLQYFSGIWLLQILVSRFQPLAGWTYPQLAFLYGLGLLSHGLMIIFFTQTWALEEYVVRGELDRFLLRPLGVFFQFIVAHVNLIGLVDLLPAVVIFAYGCRRLGFAWSGGNVLRLALVLAGATLIRAALYTATGSLAFWAGRSRALVHLDANLLERSTLYPLSFYPGWLQWGLTFLLPAGFISFYPACDFLGQADRSALPLDLALWTPGAGVIAFAAARAVFQAGLRRYESAGS